MSEYDKTNTAIAFVDSGLFCQKGVKAKGRQPILTVKINVDGVEKEIGLWFSIDKETNKYRLTKNGSKMLTGQVKDPYQSENQSAPAPTETNDTFDDDIPF